jgi:molybdate transport system substrate-binding protein
MHARAIAIVGALLMPVAASAQVKVIISGGFSGPYEKLLPEFERTSGIKVTTGSGASQGTGPQTIAAQLAAGGVFDVVIMSREGLTELIAAKRIAPGTDVDLAKALLGVCVRSGAPKPDVTTVEAFKQLMVRSKVVAMPASTGGIYLMKEVFPKLGIADQVNVKATPRGTGATAMVAAGEADIAVLPVSEILHAKGVDFVGVIHKDIQLDQTFSAAIVAGSKQAEGAEKLIAFLTSERAAPAVKAGGMEPLPGKRSGL